MLRRLTRARTIARVTGAALALTIGCGSTQTRVKTPEQTVLAFARALSEGKLEAAYALMSEDYRKRVSLEAWRAQLGASPEEVGEVSHSLSHVRGPAHEEAVLRYGDSGEIRLRKSGDRWLVASDLVSFYDQSSPRAALQAFVRALEHKRYDVVMRLVPNADKEGMTSERIQATWSGEAREELERMLASLQASLEAPIEIVGNHATMPYGERSRVQFLREDGLWKIEDPE
jgi:hypothetical protein